jgi:hypothetical protein
VRPPASKTTILETVGKVKVKCATYAAEAATGLASAEALSFHAPVTIVA